MDNEPESTKGNGELGALHPPGPGGPEGNLRRDAEARRASGILRAIQRDVSLRDFLTFAVVRAWIAVLAIASVVFAFFQRKRLQTAYSPAGKGWGAAQEGTR